MEISTNLFLDCLMLLMNDNSHRNKGYVKELITVYEEETRMIESSDADLIKFYIRILRNIIDDNIDRTNPDALRLILLKFKSDRSLINHRSVIDDLQNAFSSRETTSADYLEKIAKNITNVIMWHRTNKIMKKNYGRLSRAAELVDPEMQAAELAAVRDGMEAIVTLFSASDSVSSGEGQAFDIVNFHSRDSINTGLKKHTARNITGVLKTGLQGLNKALGKSGGIVGGESVCYGALPHMYKSGLLVSTAVWAVVHNIQAIDAKGDKPLVYLGSLENEAYQNMVWVFKQKYVMETGQSPDGMSDSDIEQWICDYFERFSTTLIIERHLPQNFGIREYMSRIAFYKSQGYKVVMAVIDYMHLMKKSGGEDPNASGAGRDVGVRVLYNSMCNLNKSNGISLVTAHPLNRKAAEVASSSTNAVKKFGLNFLADSVDVEREVDVMIYIHLESNNFGKKFLTANLTKHRYVDDTPESHKYFAYPFTPYGILDDLGMRPGYVTDIFADGYDEAAPTEQALQVAALF